MSDTDDVRIRQRMREGLRAVPTPAITPGFDERVLAGLRGRDAWWRDALANLRTAACSGACAALFAIVVARMPVDPALSSVPSPAGVGAVSAAAAPDLSAVIDDPALSCGSLWRRGLVSATRPSAAPARPAPGRSGRGGAFDPTSRPASERSSRWHASESVLC